MKTRFSSLVTLKKSDVDKSENNLRRANADLNTASMALKISYEALGDIDMPSSGNISSLLALRALLTSQRGLIQKNKEWVSFAKNQLDFAKEKFKSDMVEYEKFKYLELEEIKKKLKEQKIKEAKELDEVALMRYGQKDKR